MTISVDKRWITTAHPPLPPSSAYDETAVEVAWNMLKYRCPKSNREVTTSIETDTATLLNMRSMKLSVWCPHCGTSHQIRAADAYLDVFAVAAE